MATRGALIGVRCYHCHHLFEVGSKASSTACPACSQRLVVEDVVISRLTPVQRVQTCGRVVVRRKGSVIADLVQAQGGLEVLGSLDARVESEGPVIIGPAARWKGDCRAPSLTVEDGARIESGSFAVSGQAGLEPPRAEADAEVGGAPPGETTGGAAEPFDEIESLGPDDLLDDEPFDVL